MTREAERGWVALVATVEWRSERRHSQRPTAILAGGERSEIVDEVHWVEGPAVAGEPIVTVFEVEADDGRTYRIIVSEGRPDRVSRLVENDRASGQDVS